VLLRLNIQSSKEFVFFVVVVLAKKLLTKMLPFNLAMNWYVYIFFFHFFFSFVKFNRVWEYYENIHKNNFFFEKNETNFMMWQDILILCFYSVIYSVLVIVEALKAKVLFFSSFTITPKTLTKVFNYFYFFLFSIDWNLHFCFLLRFWFQSNICTKLQMVFVEE
jgi:hypothetical protein